VDINKLMTQLNDAVRAEDYPRAAELKRQIDQARAAQGAAAPENKFARPADWIDLGTPAWLANRLNDLGYRFATPCQANLLKALVKVVIVSGQESDGTAVDSSRFEEEWKDLALRAPTGSGKTIAFLTSILSTLSTPLYAREKSIFDAVIEVGELHQELAGGEYDAMALAKNMSYALSPALSMAELGSPTQLWLQQPPKAHRKPLALVLCPSRELAAQVGMQLHQLVGGNVRDDYRPDDELSVFNYRGPRGLRVLGLLDDADCDEAAKLACADAIVAVPSAAAKLFEKDPAYFDDLRVVAVDEGDSIIEALDRGALQGGPALVALLNDRDPSNRRTILVGATLGGGSLRKAAAARILDEQNTLLVTSDSAAPLDLSAPEVEVATKTPTVPVGLKHRVAAVPPGKAKAALVQLMRRDLGKWEAGEKGTRPRVVVFCADDAEAKIVAPVLRNALWGKHKIYALLPQSGAMPLQVLEQFAGAAGASLEAKSKQRQAKEVVTQLEAGGLSPDVAAALVGQQAGPGGAAGGGKGLEGEVDVWGAATAPTVLLTTPSAARGLDFTNLTHVYGLNIASAGLAPPSSSEAQASAAAGGSYFTDAESEYAHQAGRLGRLGNRGTMVGANPGTVTSIVRPDQLEAMLALVQRVAEPGVDLSTVSPEEYALPPEVQAALAKARAAGPPSGEDDGGDSGQGESGEAQGAGGGQGAASRDETLRALEELMLFDVEDDNQDD